MAFTLVISDGRLKDYNDEDTWVIDPNGTLTIKVANPRISSQTYSASGWLELVETTRGTEVRQTRAVIGHQPRI
jgi:hypothetical protein